MCLQCYALLVLLSMFTHSNTNTIDCSGHRACSQHTLNCDANQPCIINCDSGDKACYKANIHQNDATTMTVNCLNEYDCDHINIYCGVGGCTQNCAREVDTSCRWTHLHCDPGHCLSFNITEDFASFHCTNDCPPSLTPTSNPTLNPTSQPTSSKVPTKNPTPILSTSNPTTSQPTTISPTTHMPSTSTPITDISTTDISTSSLTTTDIPTATLIEDGTVNEIYTTDISNEYTLNKNELTTNDNKQSKILIYIILTIGSILCCCLCICIPKNYNKNKNKNYTNKEQKHMEIEIEVTNTTYAQNIQASTPTENVHGTFELNLTNVVGVNDVLMNGIFDEMNGVMIVTSDGPIVNNETNNGKFATKSAPMANNSDDERLSDDEVLNGVNTFHRKNVYGVNEKGTHGRNSDVEYDEQYIDPMLNSHT